MPVQSFFEKSFGRIPNPLNAIPKRIQPPLIGAAEARLRRKPAINNTG
jgi:hypothetical protein